MSDEIFGVGFSVDTSDLANAKVVSQQMTKALQDMAAAMEQQEQAAVKSAAADAKKAAAQREASEAARKATEAALALAQAERAAAEAKDRLKGATDAEKPALEANAKALRDQADAARAAAEASARKAAATRSAVDDAARHAQVEAVAAQRAMATTEAVRRHVEAVQQGRVAHMAAGDALLGLGTRTQTVAGHVDTLTQSLLNAGQAMQSGGGMGMDLSSLSQSLGDLGGALGGVTGGALAAGGGVLALVGAFSALVTVFGKQQEEFALLEGRLKNVYGSATAAADVFQKLTDLANRNGIAINQTAEAFLRVARNNEAIGLTTQEMLSLTDAVQKLGSVSGASQGELAGAMMQFSQALAAGRLNGDELRSIMENMPALAKAIADGLGVSVGQIRAMGAAGELTSDKITGAILKQLPKINEEFASMPETSEQAFTRVGNAWDTLIANMGKRLNSSGILRGFAGALENVLSGANEVIREETPEETVARIRDGDVTGGYLTRKTLSYGMAGAQPMVIATKLAQDIIGSFSQDEELQRALDMLEAQRKLDMAAAIKEQQKGDRAPYLRTEGIVKEIDAQSKKVNELTSNLNALEAAYALFQDKPELFEPQEAERLKRYPEYIAALKNQLAASVPVLDEYRTKTQRMFEAMLQYGAGGAASVADEASALAASMAAKGQSVLLPNGQDYTKEAATQAVLERRVQTLREQTEAMNVQIQTQQRLVEAVGQGTQAQIDAEVANKAYEMQMQMFGTTLDASASAAMDRYKDQLRDLLTIQRELTDAQKLYSTELQIAIERQITAAIQAGATADEVARLRRNLSFGQSFGEQMGGPASGVALGSGAGQIPVDLQAAFDAAATASGVPVQVLAAMAKQESGFNPAVVSPTGALGVMQILPSTAADPGYGVSPIAAEDLADPTKNIMFGAQYFAARARSAGLDISTPDGLAQALRLYNGSDQPMGDKAYAENVMRFLPTGAQSVVAQSELAAEQDAQRAQQRIADLEKQAEQLRRQAEAPDRATAISAQRQAAIDEEVRRYAPDQQEQVRAALMEKARAEEQAAIQESIRSIDEQIDKEKKLAEIAKLPARERQIETKVLEEVNRLKAQGVVLDQESIDAIRARMTEAVDLDMASASTTSREKFEQVWTETAQNIGSALEGAMRSAIMTGKVEAEDILKGLVADIATSIMRAYITQPLVNGLTSWIGGASAAPAAAAAHGMALDGGNVIPFARGGVVSGPTMFPMARGAGLMGEAGPEAVLPLKRGQDGILAVSLSRNQLQDHPEAENNPRKETASSLIDRMVERQAALTLRMTDAEPKKSETFRQFAQGGVVASPVVFPMAQGAGLMGEAGPEAILPLKRGTDGRLGVAGGAGGGMSVVINDMRSSPGAEPVEATETTGPDGQRMLQVMVRDSVRGSIKTGDLDKSMRDAFGVQRNLTRR